MIYDDHPSVPQLLHNFIDFILDFIVVGSLKDKFEMFILS